MKRRKIILFLACFLVAYIATGAVLLNYEIIQRLYIFPGWSIKHGVTDEDPSTVSSDGPIVRYENGKIIQYQISPKGNSFVTSKTEIPNNAVLNCYVDETTDSFSFSLKDRLKIPADEYALPGKLLVISDIEGNFKGFKSILLGNHIIDKDLKWTFGKNHLVLLGDFFDRGLQVTECLWLIYKLEDEAEKQGGKVHYLLGNHETMNLKGQFKYVRDKYTANADTLKLGYEQWYTRDTELGRWLRTKNAVEKIGNILFVHAGIRKDFPKDLSIRLINDNLRKSIDTDFVKGTLRDDVFIGNDGPLWYRGISKQDEDQSDVERTLARFKADQMIVGHTVMEEIKYLYHHKVIGIDLEHQENSDHGKMFALWIENGKFYTTTEKSQKSELK